MVGHQLVISLAYYNNNLALQLYFNGSTTCYLEEVMMVPYLGGLPWTLPDGDANVVIADVVVVVSAAAKSKQYPCHYCWQIAHTKKSLNNNVCSKKNFVKYKQL